MGLFLGCKEDTKIEGSHMFDMRGESKTEWTATMEVSDFGSGTINPPPNLLFLLHNQNLLFIPQDSSTRIIPSTKKCIVLGVCDWSPTLEFIYEVSGPPATMASFPNKYFQH